MRIDYAAMGRRIRARRRERKLTQEKLAERMGISASFLGHVERGSRVMSLETFVRFCETLETSPEELLGMTGRSLYAGLPQQVTVSVPGLMQGVVELLRTTGTMPMQQEQET